MGQTYGKMLIFRNEDYGTVDIRGQPAPIKNGKFEA